MLSRFYHKLLVLVAPFSLIARELSIIRELYELDLANRDKPVFRFTEQPGDDTEVIYTGEEKKPKSRMQRLFDGDLEDED